MILYINTRDCETAWVFPEWAKSAPDGIYVDQWSEFLGQVGTRARTVLNRYGIRNFVDASQLTTDEIISWRDAGKTTARNIRIALSEYGITIP